MDDKVVSSGRLLQVRIGDPRGMGYFTEGNEMGSYRGSIENLPDHTTFAPGSIQASEGDVPVYLPDRTEVGRAVVHTDGTITLRFSRDIPIAELMSENLIGLGIVYHTNEARDRVADSEGEEKDE